MKKKVNVLIPMSGRGSRFTKTHALPKPMIDVRDGMPMIEMVVRNLNIDGQYIFLVLREHYEKFDLKTLLERIVPNPKIVIVDTVTEGAACTALLAKEFINNDSPVFTANSDQFIPDFNFDDFYDKMCAENLDGGIISFEEKFGDPKWSFAKINENGFVTEVAEKVVISNIATVGMYYFGKGSDFVKYGEQMINKKLKSGNEYYITPIYNEMIADNKKIKTYHLDKFFGTGTPEDLNYFLNNYHGDL